MLESKYLTILLTPTFEKPVDTPEDIIERGLTIIYNPGSTAMKNAMLASDNQLDRDLAALTVVAEVIQYFFCKGARQSVLIKIPYDNNFCINFERGSQKGNTTHEKRSLVIMTFNFYERITLSMKG